MRAVRCRWGTALLVVAALTSCGVDSASRDEVGTGSNGSPSAVGEDVVLPFGLDAVDGLIPLGRPAVRPGIDDPDTTEMIAAFRVDADDPAGAVGAWISELEQSDELNFGGLVVEGQDDSGRDAWISADGEARDYVDLDLWATGDQPVLLVTIVQRPGAPQDPNSVDEVDGGDPPSSSIEWTERAGGDVLFEEQGTAIHLPDGSRSLMPTLPVFCGTGGSFSVVSADDGAAAVDTMIAEAQESDPNGETDGPDERTVDGAVVVTAGFTIPAGGWSFDVVSIQGSEDEAATLYVTSCAD